MTDFKVETPTKRLDQIFSLDCLKLNEMKAVFIDIFGHLTKFGIKMEELDKKMNAIPDFSKLEKAIFDHGKRLNELDKRSLTTKEDLSTQINELDDQFSIYKTEKADQMETW